MDIPLAENHNKGRFILNNETPFLGEHQNHETGIYHHILANCGSEVGITIYFLPKIAELLK